MKRALVALMALSILLLLSAGVQAEVALGKAGDIDVATDFYAEYEFRAQNYYKPDSLADTSMYGYWVHEAHFGLTGRIDKWTTRLRIKFEDFRDDANSEADEGTVAVGAAYLDYKDGLLFRAGRYETSYGTEMFYGNQEDTGIVLGYEEGRYAIRAAVHVIDETFTDREDTYMNSLKADIKLDDSSSLSIFDVMIYSKSADAADDVTGHSGADNELALHNLGVYYKGKIRDFGVTAEFNKQFGSLDYDGQSIDFKGFAAIARVDFKYRDFSPAITVGYGSGDDNDTDDSINQYVAFEPDYEPDNIVIDDKVADTNDTVSNLIFARVDVEMKYRDISITPGLGYYARAKEVNDSTAVGWEIDLVGFYKVNKMIKLKATAGYLLAGDGIGVDDPEDVYKAECKFYVMF